MRETSRGLLHGEPEQAASKQKAKVDKSVVVDANVPMQIDQNRQLATAEGNSTLDKEREEVLSLLLCSWSVSLRFSLGEKALSASPLVCYS